MAAVFPFCVQIAVRGYELDPWGHVNNAVYLNYLEHARWEMSRSHNFGGLGRDGILPVVRHLTLDYVAELLLGDTVRVGLWPRRVGTTSFTMGACLRVLAADDPARVGRLALRATKVFTCIRRPTGKVAVPDAWRAAFPADDPGDALPPGV